MLNIDIPGFGKLELKHVVLDYNGTLAFDGELLEGVSDRLFKLADIVHVHVLTADTFGRAATQLNSIPCTLHILKINNEDLQKKNYVQSLGSQNVVAIGNGNNDRSMLKAARIGIAILGSEGCAFDSMKAANLIVTNINQGIDLLLNPLRMKATLRF